METAIKSIPFNQVTTNPEPTILTGKQIFDKWFSADGGIVIGSAIYVSGTSGAGKTTLMVNLMKWLKEYKTSMYLREMESGNVKQQTRNIDFDHNNAFVCDIKSCENFNEYMKELDVLKPKVVIIDSLQVIAKEDYEVIGAVSEDAACYKIIKKLREWISKNNAILFLIGHNAKGKKGDNFAGKNTIIQMMDAHIAMTHDKERDCRIIEWGQKNRKGEMGSLMYSFEKSGIEFYTEEQWKAKNSAIKNEDFKQSFVNFTINYISNVNIESEAGLKLVQEYNKSIKKINKTDDVEKLSVDLFALMMELSNKHEM